MCLLVIVVLRKENQRVGRRAGAGGERGGRAFCCGINTPPPCLGQSCPRAPASLCHAFFSIESPRASQSPQPHLTLRSSPTFVQIPMFFISGKFLWIISVTISSHLFSISFSKNVSNSSPLFDLIPHLSLWTNLVSPHPNSWKGKVQAYLLHKDTSDWLVAYCQPQP